MGCCGCSDETSSSKVEPSTADREDARKGSEEFFVTDRSCTDLVALVVFIALLIGYAFLIGNAVKKGDIYRVINGYDDCANVCGRVTPGETDPAFSCKGADMTKKPYLLMAMGLNGVQSRQCVESCSKAGDQFTFLNRCIPKQSKETVNSLIDKLGLNSFFEETSRDLSVAWREMIYLLLIALAFSLGILVAFRFVVQWIVYIVLMGTIVVSIGGTGYLWIKWSQEKSAVNAKEIAEDDSSVTAYFTYAILLTIVTVVILLIVLVMRKRIALVMQLFREAGKAVYTMPLLLIQPVYTYFLIGVVVCIWLYCILWIESAGVIYKYTKAGKEHIDYKKDGLIILTRWYNVFLFFVTSQFLLDCQHMVIACAVARWYFTRNKNQLSCSVAHSFRYLIRYHLGTVALGSMVIGVVRLIRALIAYVQKTLKRYDNDLVKAILWCCQCCLWCFECALKFLTRNAYIETAIYGCSFCTGGKKAFQALSSNILRVAAINSVGDFVLFMGKALVVILTIVSGIFLMQKKDGLHHPWVPIALAGIFAFLVAHCFISVYEMIIDTIFICFCEDCSKNDGISRPYFMSTGLMEFVENSKAALQNLERQQASS